MFSFLKNKKTKKDNKLIINFSGYQEPEESEKSQDANNSIPRQHKKQSTQVSVDLLYARQRNLKICDCCETINEDSAKICIACGKIF